jgi:hypothetical protein
MSRRKPSNNIANCPYKDCPGKAQASKKNYPSPESSQPDHRSNGEEEAEDLAPGHSIRRRGSYWRSHDSKQISRFQCLNCRRSFSSSRSTPCFGQKKRKLNRKIDELLNSLVSQRRIAKLLKTNRKTVARKLKFLETQAHLSQEKYLDARVKEGKLVTHFHFDEMESFEVSKCLPLSIALAVESPSRLILGFKVSEMPAKGPLAAISRKKYGPRRDDRPLAAHALFSGISRVVAPGVEITSDEKSAYPGWIKAHFPHAKHEAVKGRRGCITGQGELKKIGFDPLFSLNHTAAMFRANVNRLIRKTWCTTKKKESLAAHLAIYMDYHNREILKGRAS